MEDVRAAVMDLQTALERWVREALEMRIRDEREDAMLGNEKGIRVYAFEIGSGTDPRWNPVKAEKEVVAMMLILRECEGLLAVHPTWPNTVAAFDSLNNAKAAREKLEAAGRPCGKNIMNARWYRARGEIEVRDVAKE